VTPQTGDIGNNPATWVTVRTGNIGGTASSLVALQSENALCRRLQEIAEQTGCGYWGSAGRIADALEGNLSHG
jgi:hypothetical protein